MLNKTLIWRRARTFSDFVYDAENLGQLRDSFVEELDVYLYIPWKKTEKKMLSQMHTVVESN